MAKKLSPASKKICWECYYSSGAVDENLINDEEYKRTIRMIFENRWKETVVHCPEKQRSGLLVYTVMLIEDAIKKCPKIFEHAVAAAAGEDN
jgi:hypothetical protein